MGESYVPINGFYRILCSGQARFQGRPADAVIGMRGTIGPVMGYDDLKSNFPGHAMTGAKSAAAATGKAGRGRKSGVKMITHMEPPRNHLMGPSCDHLIGPLDDHLKEPPEGVAKV